MYGFTVLIVISLAAQLLRTILTEQTAKELIKVHDGIPLLLRYLSLISIVIIIIIIISSRVIFSTISPHLPFRSFSLYLVG